MLKPLGTIALAACLSVALGAQVQKKDFPGIVNYSRVDATVGCGGRVSPAAMKALKSEGFSRPPGSPRLVTRLRALKEMEIDSHGRVRLRQHTSEQSAE